MGPALLPGHTALAPAQVLSSLCSATPVHLRCTLVRVHMCRCVHILIFPSFSSSLHLKVPSRFVFNELRSEIFRMRRKILWKFEESDEERMSVLDRGRCRREAVARTKDRQFSAPSSACVRAHRAFRAGPSYQHLLSSSASFGCPSATHRVRQKRSGSGNSTALMILQQQQLIDSGAESFRHFHRLLGENRFSNEEHPRDRLLVSLPSVEITRQRRCK